MKRLFLLVTFLFTLSANSQIDSVRYKQVQDSIRDKELFDILTPLDPEIKKPEAPPQEIITTSKDTIKSLVLPAGDTLKPVIPVSNPVADTTKSKPIVPDSLNKQPVADTLSKKLPPPDTLKPKQVIDTLSKTTLPPDTLKPRQMVDSLKTVVLPPDTMKPKALAPDSIKTVKAQDTLNKTVLPPDTAKPKEAIVDVPGKVIPPDSLRKMPLDSLSPDQLLQYYVAEPEPIPFYKGPEVGDSVYYVLNPLTIPTKTVEGEALHRYGVDSEEEELFQDSASKAEQKLKPKISLGVGRMSFNGDLYKKHFQTPSMGRPAFDFAVSHRITPYLQLDFNILFGKLGGNERLDNRNENFRSEIRAGGVNLLYDFGNFIPDRYKVRPYISFGAYGFEFLSKTDLKDKDGKTYYYWSDGSIKDRAESAPDAQNAEDLVRDYTYESDIRELNKDGFGKYPERAYAFPLGAGIVMKVTDRVDLKLNFQYYFSTTDYIDGISNKSVGDRTGTKGKDNFTYASFGLQYDLIAKPKSRSAKFQDTLSNAFWFAFDNDDRDQDSIPDMQDDCQGTPVGAKVDLKGCPVDEDNDGIPNYRDDELTTAAGVPVNARGVGQSDQYWQNWYDQYLNDSLSTERTTEYTGNIYATVVKKPKEKKDNFTVELVRYAGSIPSDELAFLLSIGDINSVTLDDGTTVVYTTGSYDKLSTAIKRRDEFRTTGNKGAGISRIKGKEIVQVPDDELQKLLESELEDLLNVNVGDSTGAAGGNTTTATVSEPSGDTEIFGKEDIVYRVQLGAFKNKISTKVFNTSAGVLELKTGENVYRYVTKGYKSIEDAAGVRADLVVQGYSDAFVTAYKGGKRIPMSQTNATMDKSYKEDLSEDRIFNSIDKKLLAFKVQLGPLKKPNQEQAMDDKVKDLTGVEKQTTSSGSIRYTAGGEFSRLDAAEKLRKELEDKGHTDAFIIATFKNEIISIQEAMELLK